MSKLKNIRELKNLTQEELSEQSGVSVRTIQRIESGNEPKGYTLKVLAKALNVEEIELITRETDRAVVLTEKNEEHKEDVTAKTEPINYSYIKLINLSSIPFSVIPPLNIIVPLILILLLKQRNTLTKQLISVQILWTILAPIVFMLGVFLKLGNKFTLFVMVTIVLSNVFIILRNAMALDKNKELHYKLNFSML